VKIRFLSIAQIELDEAVTYYDTETAGLGQVFLVEVLSAIERIRQFPNAWQPLSSNARRCRTRRFPFGVIYQAIDGRDFRCCHCNTLHLFWTLEHGDHSHDQAARSA
jgi:toxin ParE2